MAEDLQEAAQRLAELLGRRGDAETALADINAEINRLETVTLPELFASAGMAELTLADGTKLKLSDLVVGTLPKELPARAAAIAWLVENEYGDLVQTKVSASFPRGQHAEAVAARDALASGHGNNVSMEESIAPQTLCKLARDRMKNGQPVPLTLLGLQPLTRVRITNAKR